MPVDLGLIRSRIRDVPDYPEPGILFKDITPLLGDPAAFAAAVQALAESVDGADVDKVVGLEARGFIFGAPVALALGAGFVPVRKAGKLPGPTLRTSYALEYGEATVEMHRDALSAGERVLVVDDVLATGGTLLAAAALVERAGAHVSAARVLGELTALGGRARVRAALPGLDLRAVLEL